MNRLPLGVLDESISVFRKLVFNPHDRKLVPGEVLNILKTELEQEMKRETENKIKADLNRPEVEGMEE